MRHSALDCDGHHKMSDFSALVNRFTVRRDVLRQCGSTSAGWSALLGGEDHAQDARRFELRSRRVRSSHARRCGAECGDGRIHYVVLRTMQIRIRRAEPGERRAPGEVLVQWRLMPRQRRMVRRAPAMKKDHEQYP